MGAPIDAADGEAENEVKSDDDEGALYLNANLATDHYPRTEEAEDSARYSDGLTAIAQKHR